MPDGTGLTQAVVENVKDTAKTQTSAVFQEVRSELGLASSSKLQTNQTNPTSPQDPQYQQLQQKDEQEKNVKLAQIRQKIKNERFHEVQQWGTTPPALSQKEQQEEQERKEKEQEQKGKEKSFETIALPGSKNSRTDLGAVQSNSGVKAETGRGTKG